MVMDLLGLSQDSLIEHMWMLFDARKCLSSGSLCSSDWALKWQIFSSCLDELDMIGWLLMFLFLVGKLLWLFGWVGVTG